MAQKHTNLRTCHDRLSIPGAETGRRRSMLALSRAEGEVLKWADSVPLTGVEFNSTGVKVPRGHAAE